MWIMTSYGILMPASLPAEVLNRFNDEWNTNPSSPPGMGSWNLQIRSRDRATLMKARRLMIAMGSEVSVVEYTPKLDYEYRFYCDARDFADFIGAEINHIDYEKFKPTTERKGGGGRGLHNLYNSIWGVIARYYDSDAIKPMITKKKKGKKA